MSRRPWLLVTNGELAGRTFEVGPGGLRLGRSSSNDIHIPDEALSRNHCLFEADGEDGVRLTDLASANGTILNGKGPALGGRVGLAHAQELMTIHPEMSIDEVASSSGFAVRRTFSRLFKEKFGLTPTEFREAASAEAKLV